eukprot:5084238-Pyramimonas_sp.AAC.1
MERCALVSLACCLCSVHCRCYLVQAILGPRHPRFPTTSGPSSKSAPWGRVGSDRESRAGRDYTFTLRMTPHHCVPAVAADTEG